MSPLDDLTSKIVNALAILAHEQNISSASQANTTARKGRDTTNNNNTSSSSSSILFQTNCLLNKQDAATLAALHRWTDESISDFTQLITTLLLKQNTKKKATTKKNNSSSQKEEKEEGETSNDSLPAIVASCCSTIRLELFKLHSATAYRVAVQVGLSHAVTSWMLAELRLFWKLFLKPEIKSRSKNKNKLKDTQNNNDNKSSSSCSILSLALTSTLTDFNRWFSRVVSAGSTIFDFAVIESAFEAKRLILSECISEWVQYFVSVFENENEDEAEKNKKIRMMLKFWQEELHSPIMSLLGEKNDNNNNNILTRRTLSSFSSNKDLAEDICHKFGAAHQMNQWADSIRSVIESKIVVISKNIQSKNKSSHHHLQQKLESSGCSSTSIIFGLPILSSVNLNECLLSSLAELLSISSSKLCPESSPLVLHPTLRPLVCNDHKTFALRSKISTMIAACDSTLFFRSFGNSLNQVAGYFSPTPNQLLNSGSMSSTSRAFVSKTLRSLMIVNSGNTMMELISGITRRLAMLMATSTTTSNNSKHQDPTSPKQQQQRNSVAITTNRQKQQQQQQQQRQQSRAARFMLDYESLQRQLLSEMEYILTQEQQSLNFVPPALRIRSGIWKIVSLLSGIQYHQNTSTTTTSGNISSGVPTSSSFFDFPAIRSLFKSENFSAALLGVDPAESHHHTARPEHGAALSPSSSLDTMLPGEQDLSLAVFRISAAISTIPTGTINAVDVLRRMLVRRQRMGGYSINNNNSSSSSSSAIISCAQLDAASADIDVNNSSSAGGGGIGDSGGGSGGGKGGSGIGGSDSVPIAFSTPVPGGGRLLDWVTVQVPSQTTIHAVLDVIGSVVPIFAEARPALLRQTVGLLVSPALPTEKLAEYLSTMMMISSSSPSSSSCRPQQQQQQHCLHHGDARSFALHVITSATQSYSLSRLRRAIEPLILKVGFQFPLLTPEFAEVIKQFSIFGGSSSSSRQGSLNNNNSSSSSSAEVAISKISAENLILALERRVSDVRPVDRDFGASLLRCARQALTHQATILKMLKIAGTTLSKHQQQYLKSKRQKQKSHNNNNCSLLYFNLHQHQKLIDAFTRRSHEVCLRLFRVIANRFEDILVSSEATMMLASLQTLDLTTASEVTGVSLNGLPATVKSISHSILGSAHVLSTTNNNNTNEDPTELNNDKNNKKDTQKTKSASQIFDWNRVRFEAKSYHGNNNNTSSSPPTVSCQIHVTVSNAKRDDSSRQFFDDDDDDDADQDQNEETRDQKYKHLVTFEIWGPRTPLQKNKNTSSSSSKSPNRKPKQKQKTTRQLLESYTTFLDVKPVVTRQQQQQTHQSLFLGSPLSSPKAPIVTKKKKNEASDNTTSSSLSIFLSCNQFRVPASSSSVSPFAPYQDCLGVSEPSLVDQFLEEEQEEEEENQREEPGKPRQSKSNLKFLTSGHEDKEKDDDDDDDKDKNTNNCDRDENDNDADVNEEYDDENQSNDQEDRDHDDNKDEDEHDDENQDNDDQQAVDENQDESDQQQQEQSSSLSSSSCDAPLLVIRLAHQKYYPHQQHINKNNESQQQQQQQSLMTMIPKPICVLPLSLSSSMTWVKPPHENENEEEEQERDERTLLLLLTKKMQEKLNSISTSQEEDAEQDLGRQLLLLSSNSTSSSSSSKKQKQQATTVMSHEDRLRQNLLNSDTKNSHLQQQQDDDEDLVKKKNNNNINGEDLMFIESAVVIPVLVDPSDESGDDEDEDEDENGLCSTALENKMKNILNEKRRSKIDEIKQFFRQNIISVEDNNNIDDDDDKTSSSFMFISRARFPHILVGVKIIEGQDDDFIVLRLFAIEVVSSSSQNNQNNITQSSSSYSTLLTMNSLDAVESAIVDAFAL